MLSKAALLKEIETLPDDCIDEVYKYILHLRNEKMEIKCDEITLASEHSLSKEWLLPDEDAVWANL